MVDKYVKPSISGFNSSPPPDDDSETAANAISWAGIKNKLADPIKTLLDSVNTGVDTLADSLFGNAVRADSAGGTMTTSDYGKLIKTSNAITITLLTGGDAGSNFVFAFYNADSTNNLTIARNGNNINGAASNLTITPGEGGIAFCDGTDWWVIRAIFNSTANTFTFNKEIVLGASSEVSTANSLQNVTNTLYHLATGTSWIFKAQGTGAVNDRLKIYADGVVGCNGSGNEVTGGKKGEGTANFIQVWDNGARVWSATTQSILSLAKAYCYWNTSGTTILTSFNVTSVTNSAVGSEVVNLTTAFSTANFAVGSSGGGQTSIINAAPASASTIQVDLINQQDSLTTIDDPQCSVIAFGEQ